MISLSLSRVFDVAPEGCPAPEPYVLLGAMRIAVSPPLVLVVDDEAACRLIVCEMLADAGFVCLEAGDGVAATRMACQTQLRLAVVDLLMPNKDGIETIVDLRRRSPETRLVAMSGGSGKLEAPHLLHTARELGADAVLFKPFRPAELLQAVHAALAAVR